jgi:hypothetical protein
VWVRSTLLIIWEITLAMYLISKKEGKGGKHVAGVFENVRK